jgi:ABC-type Co2+ transport system permease subunit
MCTDMARVVSGLSQVVIVGISVGAGALLALVAFLALVALRLKRRADEERKKNPFGTARSLSFLISHIKVS